MRQAPIARDASLLLLGNTNLSGHSFAILRLTNGSRAHIACMPEAFEQASAGAWVRTPLVNGANRALRGWIGVREELKPSEAFTFLVPPPTTNSVWRFVFMCQEQATLVDPVTDAVRAVTDTNALRNQLRQFSGRRYYATSPDIVP